MRTSNQVPSFYNKASDSNLSPSCCSQQDNTRHASFHEPTTVASSPLRQRPLFPIQSSSGFQANDENIFFQSPCTPVPRARSLFSSNSYLKAVDDDESAILLQSPSGPSSPLFPIATTQTLLTPVKQVHRVVEGLGDVPVEDSPSMRAPQSTGKGLKRKSVSARQCTPLRQHSLTPLSLTSSIVGKSGHLDGAVFDRLAPLPAPKFSARTPQTKKDTEAHLRRQTATMTKLRITDSNESVDDFDSGHDSGCDLGDDGVTEDALFLGGGTQNETFGKFGAALRLARRGNGNEEVAEAISPGGHIVKRRARTRPLSDELLKSSRATPSPPGISSAMKSASFDQSAVVFPKTSRLRDRKSSDSSSETGSPAPRRRVSGLHAPKLPMMPPNSHRAPFNRVDSATLFFGSPSLASSAAASSNLSRRVTTSISSNATAFSADIRPKVLNRHSYSGSGAAETWSAIQTRVDASSPQSSPPLSHMATNDTEGFDTDDEAMMVDIPPSSSFVLNVTEETHSPRRSGRPSDRISKKYATRDSGIVLSDDEEMDSVESSTSSELLNVMPRASNSVSSLYSDGEDGLVTPGVAPRGSSGWPETVIINGSTDGSSDLSSGVIQDVDAFILRTLAAAAKAPQETKRAPGTPVKKAKISYLSGARPWQSAVARKVGFGLQDEERKAKVPRKSMPAAFPSLGRRSGRPLLDSSTDSESDSDESPSNRKDRYSGLGLGRPSFSGHGGKDGISKARWLLRRSSSGAFSSGSDSMSVVGTPTRSNRLGKTLRSPSTQLPIQYSPSKNKLRMSPARTASNSSSGSSVYSPRGLRPFPLTDGPNTGGIRLSGRMRRLSQPSEQERTGRFDRDFVEIAEVGSGEFGKVIKVRQKAGAKDEFSAIKKSKRFEGARHRLRLREEIDILRHLSQRHGGQPHPNVLAFIDAWEEDEHLYMWTELCEGGNFAHFLWEYGRNFPRLDESRVWKIIAELSNGLLFIHDAGVIHLDLKPANIFVTSEGRFKIGDFGMASLWPRPYTPTSSAGSSSFEREGDKLYLAPEVLQGKYGKAADIFSFGMTILEAAANIVVPDQGEAWHRLRNEDFSQVDLDDSPQLLRLIQQMMRTEPSLRINIHAVYSHPVVSRARARMQQLYVTAKQAGMSLFTASPLASVSEDFLPAVLGV